jgi:hypothetical protein
MMYEEHTQLSWQPELVAEIYLSFAFHSVLEEGLIYSSLLSLDIRPHLWSSGQNSRL